MFSKSENEGPCQSLEMVSHNYILIHKEFLKGNAQYKLILALSPELSKDSQKIFAYSSNYIFPFKFLLS